MMSEYLVPIKPVEIYLGWAEALEVLETLAKDVKPSDLRSSHLNRLKNVMIALQQKFNRKREECIKANVPITERVEQIGDDDVQMAWLVRR